VTWLVALIVALTAPSAGGDYQLRCVPNIGNGQTHVAEDPILVELDTRSCRAFRLAVQYRLPTRGPNREEPFMDGLGTVLHESRHVFQARQGWFDERGPNFKGWWWVENKSELDAECWAGDHIDDLALKLGYSRRWARHLHSHYRWITEVAGADSPPYGGKCLTRMEER
jgi:hypothetical protein